jgi:hypothetical protein
MDLALCIKWTRAADLWLMKRGDPFVRAKCETLAYKLRRRLIQRITEEDPLVLRAGSILAGGAGEYTALVNRMVKLHG